MVKQILSLVVLLTLVACAILTPQLAQPSPSSTSSAIASKTSSSTNTATAEPQPTPFWGPAAWVCADTCKPSDNDPVVWEVKPGERVNLSSEIAFTYRLNSQVPLSLSSFQTDLLIEDNGYSGSPFSVLMDLHGYGTVRSWYAQMGYTYNNGNLGIFCQAFSYSNNAPRYWNDAPYSPDLNTWHTFKIEVTQTEVGWHYAFRYWYDGVEICDYQPPDLWDGDNRYRVIQQGVQIYPDGAVNSTTTSIRAEVRNVYLYVLNSPD